jgi:hypothetical protein
MSKHHKKIEQLTGEIAESKLDIQHKAYAVDVLGEVDATTNGVTDKPQAMTDAILALTAYMIRRDIYLQDTHSKQIETLSKMVSDSVASHADTCPLADQIPTLVIDAMKAQALKEDGSQVTSGNTTVNLGGYRATGKGSVILGLAACLTICWIGYLIGKGAGII